MKYMRKINFSQKNQNPIVCSIKIVNLWKTVLIIPVYRYSFLVSAICDLRKKFPPAKFPIPSTGGGIPPTP